MVGEVAEEVICNLSRCHAKLLSDPIDHRIHALRLYGTFTSEETKDGTGLIYGVLSWGTGPATCNSRSNAWGKSIGDNPCHIGIGWCGRNDWIRNTTNTATWRTRMEWSCGIPRLTVWVIQQAAYAAWR